MGALNGSFETLKSMPGEYGHFFAAALEKHGRLVAPLKMWPAHTSTEENREFCRRTIAKTRDIAGEVSAEPSIDKLLKAKAKDELEEFEQMFLEMAKTLDEYR